MITHYIETRCPWCGRSQDASTPADGSASPPKEHDAGFCVDCGEWSIFHGGKRCKPTDDEWDQLVALPIVQDTRRAWLKMKAKRHG